MIRVLIVDDSPVVRGRLEHLFAQDDALLVVGTAADGVEALEAVAKLKPDVVTMDLNMPVLGGVEATRRLMAQHPLPIVVVSSSGSREAQAGVEALAAGALEVMLLPLPGEGADLVRTVKLLSEVRVVRRSALRPLVPRTIDIVAVGASTGGPTALIRFLKALPLLDCPMLVVQHIAPGFLDNLLAWMSQSTGRTLHLAADGVAAQPGEVYFAPDGHHLHIEEGCLRLSEEDPDQGLRPSVSHLFRSVRRAYGGAAAAVLLSGMGRDGAEELKCLRDEGALTLVQDSTAVVDGMPGAARELGAACHVLPPEGIAAVLAHHRRVP